MRVGVIGSGNIGSTVGALLCKAGHEVRFSSRHPDKLRAFAAELGPRASVGSAREAAEFGEVVLLAVPFAATPALEPEVKRALAGKLVLDAGNVYPARDGDAAREAIAAGQGSGAWTAKHLPGARVVKAFNTVFFKTLASEAHRGGPRVGIPLAGDDKAALDQAAALVREIGFDPVVVGPLARAKDFDVGTKVYNTGMNGDEVRSALGVAAG